MPESTTEVKSSRVQLRPETRAMYDGVCAIKRWSLTDAADLAIARLIETDPELEPLRHLVSQPAVSQRQPNN